MWFPGLPPLDRLLELQTLDIWRCSPPNILYLWKILSNSEHWTLFLMSTVKVPKYPISVIDFHGTEDDTIPYDVNSPECVGEGPQGNSVFTKMVQENRGFSLCLAFLWWTLQEPWLRLMGFTTTQRQLSLPGTIHTVLKIWAWAYRAYLKKVVVCKLWKLHWVTLCCRHCLPELLEQSK